MDTFTFNTEEVTQGYITRIMFVRSFSYEKDQQTFKINPVNLQSRSPRTLIKRTPDMEVSI